MLLKKQTKKKITTYCNCILKIVRDTNKQKHYLRKDPLHTDWSSLLEAGDTIFSQSSQCRYFINFKRNQGNIFCPTLSSHERHPEFPTSTFYPNQSPGLYCTSGAQMPLSLSPLKRLLEMGPHIQPYCQGTAWVWGALLKAELSKLK